eukprot:6211985-Pleurochrysis_carterae.AAC.1
MSSTVARLISGQRGADSGMFRCALAESGEEGWPPALPSMRRSHQAARAGVRSTLQQKCQCAS